MEEHPDMKKGSVEKLQFIDMGLNKKKEEKRSKFPDPVFTIVLPANSK